MSNNSEQTHSIWDLLADHLGRPGGLELARMLAFAGLLGDGHADSTPSPSAPSPSTSAPTSSAALADEPRPIGPWSPSIENGRAVFVREPFSGKDFIWWKPSFEREVLEPKVAGGPRRVCVIGESAAAGMFYTPHFTPSQALATHLLRALPQEPFEVIDLTRNSMNAVEAVETARAAMQLQPDYLVVFGGNNWFAGQGLSWDAPAEVRCDYVESMMQQGQKGILATFRERVLEVTDRTLGALASLAEGSTTKLLFAIPAVNPAWERAEPVVWLGGNRTKRWHERHASAVRALTQQKWAQALEAADAMLVLDDGTCPTGHRLRGKALLGLRRDQEAAEAFDRELDCANMFEMFCQTIPGTPSYVRQRIRETADRRGFFCVDVPEIFAEHAGSMVSSHRLFVDYCHMTPEGMVVAMAAVAEALATDVHAGGVSSWQSLVARDETKVDARVEAIARFYTAIYAVHFENATLPAERTRLAERVRSALELAPEIAPFMRDYMRARNGAIIGCPLLSGAAQRVITQSNNPFLDYAAVRGAGGVDGEAMSAVAEALDALDGSGAAALTEYLQPYQRMLRRGVDLSEPLFVEHVGSAVPWLKYESERTTRRALPIFRAVWAQSVFTLVADGQNDVDVELVCRVPGLAKGAKAVVRVALDGAPIAEFPVAGEWTGRHVTVASSKLPAGVHRLTVEWPALAGDDGAAWTEAVNRFRTAVRPDVFPIFGEIFSFVARARAS